MKQIINKVAHGIMVFALCLFSSINSVSAAPPLALSTIPLFSGNTEIPNVFFTIDDSGSMDWEILMKNYWHSCAYDSNSAVDSGSADCTPTVYDKASAVVTTGYITSGQMATYSNSSAPYDHAEFHFIYNQDNAYTTNCDTTSNRRSYEDCATNTGIDADWRLRSSDLNVIYYNPAQVFSPWQGSTAVLGNAVFTAAKADPRAGTTGNASAFDRNLSGFVYEVWIDDRGFTASANRPRRGTNVNANSTTNGVVDLWDSHYRVTVNASSFTVQKISYSPSTSGLNEGSPVTVTDSTELQKALGVSAPNTTRTLAEVQQNVANWYQYSRRRSFVAKGATGAVITANPYFRYGLSVFNGYSSLFTEVPVTTNFPAYNKGLLDSFFSYDWPTNTTPLRQGLERMGQYYAGNLSGHNSPKPIISECQQNFGVLLTDGYWNGNAPAGAIGDEDGDGHSPTAADVAKYYYETDLDTNLADSVPTTAKDNNKQQHMVTFTAAFGVEGNLVDTDNDGLPNPLLAEGGDWGDPINSTPAKIDDLWHAAFNSKGEFISAATPQALVDGFSDALGDVASRTSSASAVAANSTTLNAGSALFQALFKSGEWSGDLRKLLVSDGNASSGVCLNVARGSVCQTPVWKATDQLAGQNFSTERTIITYNDTAGIPFDFPSGYSTIVGGSPDATKMTKAQIEALLTNAPFSASTGVSSEITDNQTFGDNLVDYFRGDSANEGTGQNFRVRTSKLGDIVNSAPVFVGAPRFRYSDSIESAPYSTYVTNNKTRAEMVYVGANDGMLHGFEVATGDEKLAYVPAAVYANLNKLHEPTYNHGYYVDGSPVVGDAFFASDSTWRSILVGGLNAGGKAVYALDVSNPNNFLESKADDLVLWEFTHANLGYTFGNPDIVKMNNGKWAAIFGNGYNNTGNGQAEIFIVDIETGVLIKEISTGDLAGTVDASNPNGMSTVTPVDENGDSVVDYIYGGDLLGNLWKFTVSDANTSKWEVAYATGNGANAVPAPLFTAVSPDTGTPAQPITTRPTVTKHPDGSQDGFMVYFGTGKYLETTDNQSTGQVTQTFYGIWDKNQSSLTAISKTNDLLQQEISSEEVNQYDSNGILTTNTSLAVSSVGIRITTDTTIDWSVHSGWYMDLINTGDATPANKGERQVSNPIVRNGRIIFTTLVPSQSTCDFGGTSWLMELDAASGSRLSVPPFDLNNDGVIDDQDAFLAANNDKIPPGGVQFDGIITMPRILGGGNIDYKNFGNTASQNVTTLGEGVGENLGRASWRQISKEY